MGFEDRDYFRDDGTQGPRWGQETPSTRNLLVITVIVFLLQTVFTREGGLDGVVRFGARRISLIDEWFMLDAASVLSGQVWRLLSYVFCHDRQAPFGLVFNMLGLWFLGSRLERMYGSREILYFYLGTALTSGLVFTLFGFSTAIDNPLSGAQPAVLGLFALYACHFPREKILFFWMIPVEIRVLLLIYAGLDIYFVLQASQGDVPMAVAAFAASHLAGIAVALMYHHFDFHLTGIFSQFAAARSRRSLQRRAAQSHLRVYSPDTESQELDSAVDAILAKIHEQGSDSLNDSERAILTKASERAKQKQR